MPELPLWAAQPYQILLVCHDKFDNPCTTGGTVVTGRLQGPNMPPGQDTNVEVEDRQDGTYILHVTLKAPCDVKLNVSIARDQLTPNSEFAPISLSFVSSRLKGEGAGGRRMSIRANSTRDLLGQHLSDGLAAGEADTDGSDDHEGSMRKRAADGRKTYKLRGAVDDIMTGMGIRDDRRSRKVTGSAQMAVEMAASAFAAAGKAAPQEQPLATATVTADASTDDV